MTVRATPVATLNDAQRAHIIEVLQLTDTQLLDIPGLGPVSLLEVRRALEDNIRRLRYSGEHYRPDGDGSSRPPAPARGA